MPLNTRATNSNVHPGENHNRYTIQRRSAEVIQAEREAKATIQANKTEKQLTGTKDAAKLEHMARQKAQRAKMNSGASDSRLGIPRSSRTRLISEVENDVIVQRQQVIKHTKGKQFVEKTVYGEISGDYESDHGAASQPDISDKGEPAEIIESEGSGSEFNPEPSKDEAEDDEDDEMDDVELEDDEPDTQVRAMKGKKVKKGIMARDQVRVMREQIVSKDIIGETAVKRKPSLTAERLHTSGKAKKSKKSVPYGVRTNWDTDEILLPEPRQRTTTPSSSSYQYGSDRDFGPVQSSRKSHQSESEGGSAFQAGGFSSENEDNGLEYHAIEQSQGAKFRSIAKVEDIDNSLVLKKPDRGKRPTYKHLPEDAAKSFDIIKVIACDILGSMDAWFPLSDMQIVTIWHKLWQEKYPITENRAGNSVATVVGSYDLFEIVKRLINNKVSSWTNSFAKAAVTALEDEYQLRKLTSLEQRAEFVKRILGNENQTDKDRPFLWQTTDDVDWNNDDKKGIFLGCMVLKTLAEHVATVELSIEIDPKVHKLSDKPRGALILAIQAVHRALLYSVTGAFQAPSKKDGEFSRTNWGDIETEAALPGSSRKKLKLTRRATVFKARIDGLSDAHWKAILDGARLKTRKRKVVQRMSEVLMEVAEVIVSDEENDDILFDPMFA